MACTGAILSCLTHSGGTRQPESESVRLVGGDKFVVDYSHPLVIKLKLNTPQHLRVRIKLDDCGFEKSHSEPQKWSEKKRERRSEKSERMIHGPLENLIFTMQMVNLINVQSWEPRHIIP